MQLLDAAAVEDSVGGGAAAAVAADIAVRAIKPRLLLLPLLSIPHFNSCCCCSKQHRRQPCSTTSCTTTHCQMQQHPHPMWATTYHTTSLVDSASAAAETAGYCYNGWLLLLTPCHTRCIQYLVAAATAAATTCVMPLPLLLALLVLMLLLLLASHVCCCCCFRCSGSRTPARAAAADAECHGITGDPATQHQTALRPHSQHPATPFKPPATLHHAAHITSLDPASVVATARCRC